MSAIQDTKISARGFNATQPARVQVQNTIENMRKMRDGNDIRKYSASARKELIHGGEIEILAKDGETTVGVVPKLALVVVSSIFSDHLEKKPDVTSVKVSNDKIDNAAVSTLLKWINSITKSVGKYGVNVPGSPVELIKVRHAAQMLGMDKYITHFAKAYKAGLRERLPPIAECVLLERCSVDTQDEMIKALGERLAYLRRSRAFTKTDLSTLTDVLKANVKIDQAVRAADARVGAKRAGVST